MKEARKSRGREGVATGKVLDYDHAPPAIAVSDDDFEEYEEFLAWKRKHGLRATIRRMAKRDRFAGEEHEDVADLIEKRR